jgi:hypothetical protein
MKTFVLCAVTILTLSLVGGMLSCRPSARPDDALEPNDDFEHATILTAGQAVTARANQWNADVFAFNCEAKGTIVFSLQSLGHEDCAAFTVTGPNGEILYQDSGTSCSDRGPWEKPAMQAEGVKFTEVKDFGYEIDVPANTVGTYFLQIVERSQADNILPFSWDYRLTVTIK